MDSEAVPFLPKGRGFSVENGDSCHLDTQSLTPQRIRQRRILVVFRCIFVALAIWGLVALCSLAFFGVRWLFQPVLSHKTLEFDVYRPSTLQPGLNLCDCGSTIEEALQRDCVYDSLSTAWLPPYCRDDELTAEFDRSGPEPDGSWPYYADEAGSVRLNTTQIAALGPTEGRFWALREWHVAHCLFYWQKYWRMRDTGAVMELRFDKLEHVKHCGKLALNKQPDHRVLIEVPVLMRSRLVEPEELEHHSS